MLRNKKYVYSEHDIKVPISLNLGEFVLNSILQYQDRVAFIDAHTQEKLTFSEIAQNAMNVAVSLVQQGVRKGETIAVCSENRSEFWPTVIGTLLAGAVITPISVVYTKDELKHILGISKPKYIFCSPFAYKAHKSTIQSTKHIRKVYLYGDEKTSNEILYKDLVKNVNVKREDFMPVEVQGQTDDAVILYSSGTTGLPKGVVLTHFNGLVYCSFIKFDEPQDPMTVLSIAPWYHAYGMWGNIGSMCNGRTNVYIKRFEEKLFLETIQRYKISVLFLVPPILVLLSKSQILKNYDVTSVTQINCGAAPLDVETIDEVKRRFPNVEGVMQGYGMTESTLALCKDNLFQPYKAGSVGTATPSTVLKVVDLKTREPLGPNQPGEICAKGALIMKGYIGRPRSEDFDDEGFYRSGDIGYYDEDGYFFIVDRLKELIKYKGFQVPPAEIEAELLKHPAIRDAGVVGVPDRASGELPLAFVVTQPGAAVTEREIQSYVAEKLSNPKQLRGGVRFVNEIPKNPSGKILRRILRDMLKSGKSKL
ncbi:unnamed protein product [Plutella xylostella]|uniref:(diamondback moth) hypothetical protein n=1 Tax=Plutella xylostella TaxID=51655 RepID=A0A8S4G5F1_PLUXY|nr:unnamed protein product [Plutella xylostella]